MLNQNIENIIDQNLDISFKEMIDQEIECQKKLPILLIPAHQNNAYYMDLNGTFLGSVNLTLDKIKERPLKDFPQEMISVIKHMQFVNHDLKTLTIHEFVAGIPIFKNPYRKNPVFSYVTEKTNTLFPREGVSIESLNSIWDIFSIFHELGHAFGSDKYDKELSTLRYLAKAKEAMFGFVNSSQHLPEGLTEEDLLKELAHDEESTYAVGQFRDPITKKIVLTKEDSDIIIQKEEEAWEFVYEKIQDLFEFLGLDFEQYREVFEKYIALNLLYYHKFFKSFVGKEIYQVYKERKLHS